MPLSERSRKTEEEKAQENQKRLRWGLLYGLKRRQAMVRETSKKKGEERNPINRWINLG